MNNPSSTDPREALALVLSDLCPEELEPRLELQVLVDPMNFVVAASNNNNNNNNNKRQF